MTERFIEAKKQIDRAQNIALSTHENPDLDGLGSLLALESVLRNLGKNTYAFSVNPVSDALKFLPHQRITNNLNPKKIDLIIGLDYGSPERLEILKAYPEIQANVLTFDHHAIGEHLGLKIVDGDISSTAEIVHNFINFLEAPIDSAVALCLLAGIMSDTSGFRHINTSAQTLKTAGELMLKGASLQKISRAVNNLNNMDKKLAGLTDIFKKIQIVAKANLVFVVINHKLFTFSSKGLEKIDVANILSAIPEAKIAATLIEKIPGCFDISLRSQQDRGVNVARIAQSFGGGGHRLAAGFHSDKSPEEIVAQIEKLLLAADK